MIVMRSQQFQDCRIYNAYYALFKHFLQYAQPCKKKRNVFYGQGEMKIV